MNKVKGENQCDYSPIALRYYSLIVSRKSFQNLNNEQKQPIGNKHSLQKGEKPSQKSAFSR